MPRFMIAASEYDWKLATIAPASETSCGFTDGRHIGIHTFLSAQGGLRQSPLMLVAPGFIRERPVGLTLIQLKDQARMKNGIINSESNVQAIIGFLLPVLAYRSQRANRMCLQRAV